MALVFENAVLVTGNSKDEVLYGGLRVEGATIQALGPQVKAEPDDEVVDLGGAFLIPGLVQLHTHLCQALFRGMADDLALIDWLEKKIWPMEAGHTPESLKASARIGLEEMLLSGTTCILDMGTVHHTQTLFEEAERSGIRYFGGKCLMDIKEYSGPLFEETGSSLSENLELLQEWKSRNPLVKCVVSPRFAVSCSDELLTKSFEQAQEFGTLFHTHASETKDEVRIVEKRSGLRNVDFLSRLGLLGSRTVLVHGVHLNDEELDKMVESRTSLAHCPSANLKLASGFAPIQKYLKRGLNVGIGCDGAPCNNHMDPFREMRLAALLQKPLFGPTALPARKAFELATRGGARALGMEAHTGSLEVGKAADLVVVGRDHPSMATVEDPFSALVYSATGRDVRHVLVAGRWVVKEARLVQNYMKF